MDPAGEVDGAFDVDVEVAQQFPLRDQRRDQARALVDPFRSVRPVPQARGTGSARLGDPRGECMQQRSGIFAARQQRAGDAQAMRAAQYQQHALGADEMRCFVDQERAQGVAVAPHLLAALPKMNDQTTDEEVLRRLRESYNVYNYLGQTERAITFAEKVIQIDANDHAMRRALARLLISVHRYDEARRELNWCLRRFPDDQQLVALLAATNREQFQR